MIPSPCRASRIVRRASGSPSASTTRMGRFSLSMSKCTWCPQSFLERDARSLGCAHATDRAGLCGHLCAPWEQECHLSQPFRLTDSRPMKSLLLIADHPMVVQAIRVALRHTAAFRVVATVDGRSTARDRLSELRPEIVLVDEMCQRTNALARLREAREEAPGAMVVLLASGLEPAAVSEALEAGAHAVTSGTLLREVVHGNVVHAPPARSEPPALSTDHSLTARELEVLRLVCEG